MANRVLRDHSEPCKHDEGAWNELGAEGELWQCTTIDCPGGREVTIDETQVPNWWIEHDAHAILGAKLGTIEAGWRYFCGLVDIALDV